LQEGKKIQTLEDATQAFYTVLPIDDVFTRIAA